MLNPSPKVTVLMPVYNGEKYLREAIDSILNQTFTDFEFLIIDDGSSDRSVEIIRSYQDPRIQLVCSSINRGLAHSLNLGLSIAKGDYIARMDCDDISLCQRFDLQVKYLKQHPEVEIIGGFCQSFDEKSDFLGIYTVPSHDLEIRWSSLLKSPFAHPTIMIRRALLIENNLTYDSQFQAAEDYNLWTYSLNYTKGFNFPYPLLRYRIRDGITRSKREQQLKEHDFIAHRTIRSTLPDFPVTPEQVTLMRSLLITEEFFDETGTLKVAQLQEAITLYLAMLSAFLDTHAAHPEKNHLKRQEILKIGRLLYRLSKRAGFDTVLAPQLRSLTRLLWK